LESITKKTKNAEKLKYFILLAKIRYANEETILAIDKLKEGFKLEFGSFNQLTKQGESIKELFLDLKVLWIKYRKDFYSIKNCLNTYKKHVLRD